MVIQARIIATEAHRDQVDKAGMPYILHPERVAKLVAHLGPWYEATAWLHDVVEDTDISLKTVFDVFGWQVMMGVLGVTRIEQRYADRLGFPVTIKETYRDFVNRSRTNPISWAVKIADVRQRDPSGTSSPRGAGLPP